MKANDLEITHSTLRLTKDEYLINLAVDTKKNGAKSNYFVCCIDISGSMSESATNDNKDVEASKFSRWDLVKHCVKTIISSLKDDDQLCVITFSNKANIKIPFTKMNKSGKQSAMNQLNSINVGGGTNLWDGLKTTLEYIYKNVKMDSNSNVYSLVLTDGEPNENPPLGIMHEFSKLYDEKPVKATVSCFGYGYNLDSKLLNDISVYGGGFFTHVPDHSMCSTVFVNYLSNSLASAINKVEVYLPGNIQECVSHPMFNKRVKLGSVQSGQSKNVLLKVKTSDPKAVDFDFEFDFDGKKLKYQITSLDSPTEFHELDLKSVSLNNDQLKFLLSNPCFGFHFPKFLLQKTIQNVIDSSNIGQACKELDNLYQTIENQLSLCTQETLKENLEALLKDIKSGETNEGQIYKSVSNKDWFNKWGIHYLRYLLRSHQLQSCTNFKDSSLQIYGGELFKKIKSEVEDIFSKIPAPKPSRSKTEFKGNYTQTFYCRSGGCVDGSGRVSTKEGSKLVRDLRKGDVIVNSHGQFDTVVCVLKRKVENGYMDMFSFNGMKITPWHPIRLGDSNQWTFPTSIAGHPLKINCDYVYNFVLSNHHFVTINGIDVITLGHGYDVDCLAHPFFGTQKVVQQLKSHDGWESGFIEYKYKPSYQNGLVSSLW